MISAAVFGWVQSVSLCYLQLDFLWDWSECGLSLPPRWSRQVLSLARRCLFLLAVNISLCCAFFAADFPGWPGVWLRLWWPGAPLTCAQEKSMEVQCVHLHNKTPAALWEQADTASNCLAPAVALTWSSFFVNKIIMKCAAITYLCASLFLMPVEEIRSIINYKKEEFWSVAWQPAVMLF